MTVTTQQNTIKVPRAELIQLMRERDGDVCMHPDCGKPLDFELIGSEHKLEPTIDHWMPQVWCREQGRVFDEKTEEWTVVDEDKVWTFEQIWDIDNLKLMHKQCNAKKGQLVPNPDGSIPAKPVKEFRYRRDRRQARPEICKVCMSGRMLDIDEICNVCGSGPQPALFPRAHAKSPKDCSHSGPESCWACVLGIEARIPAIVSVLDGERSLDEIRD